MGPRLARSPRPGRPPNQVCLAGFRAPHGGHFIFAFTVDGRPAGVPLINRQPLPATRPRSVHPGPALGDQPQHQVTGSPRWASRLSTAACWDTTTTRSAETYDCHILLSAARKLEEVLYNIRAGYFRSDVPVPDRFSGPCSSSSDSN